MPKAPGNCQVPGLFVPKEVKMQILIAFFAAIIGTNLTVTASALTFKITASRFFTTILAGVMSFATALVTLCLATT